MENIQKIMIVCAIVCSILLCFAAFYMSANAITIANDNKNRINKLENDIHYLENIKQHSDTIVININNIKK